MDELSTFPENSIFAEMFIGLDLSDCEESVFDNERVPCKFEDIFQRIQIFIGTNDLYIHLQNDAPQENALLTGNQQLV